MLMVLLDLFCGRWGWSRAFAKRGWKCIGVDLTKPPEIPEGCEFIQADVLGIRIESGVFIITDIYGVIHRIRPDAVVASSPCEKFSVFGMRHFHPNPPYPGSGIRLFEHTQALCEANGLPYVIENVRSAQQFVGDARHHCGPFYLWGNAVPPLVNQGIVKGMSAFQGDCRGAERKLPLEEKRRIRKERGKGLYEKASELRASQTATIPHELANCVAEFMERILETRLAKSS